jgi:hypothetical protein
VFDALDGRLKCHRERAKINGLKQPVRVELQTTREELIEKVDAYLRGIADREGSALNGAQRSELRSETVSLSTERQANESHWSTNREPTNCLMYTSGKPESRRRGKPTHGKSNKDIRISRLNGWIVESEQTVVEWGANRTVLIETR